MNFDRIRERSISIAQGIGYQVNFNLPTSDFKIQKGGGEVVARILCLDVCLSVSYGFDRSLAKRWIESEGLEGYLTDKERMLVDGLAKDFLIDFHVQADALFLLLWYVGVIKDMKLVDPLVSNLVSYVPDMRVMEGSANFRREVEFKSPESLYQMADLAYLLHWSVVNARIHGVKIPAKINPISLIERRRAMEWLLSNSDWDNVSLDT